MKKKQSTLMLILAGFVSLAVLMLGGCGGGEEAAEAETVELVYVNWAEGIAMTNLAKVILEDRMDYQVEMTAADVAPVYSSLAQGDQDAFMDGWLPVTHGSYMEEYGESVVDLGYNYRGARIGLVVPEYVEVDSITQLNEYADRFEGKIIGIDAGAGIMKATDAAIDAYGLDLTLVPSSGPAMTAALKNAVENDEWIVVTGWRPHWKFARWDLKFLADPEGIYGETENIHTIARQDIREDLPRVAQFLENFQMNDQQLGTLMGMIADSEGDPPEAQARAWMAMNMDLVESWIPPEE